MESFKKHRSRRVNGYFFTHRQIQLDQDFADFIT